MNANMDQFTIHSGRESDGDWIARLYHDVWHETHAPLMPKDASELRPLAYFQTRTAHLMAKCFVGIDLNGQGLGFCAWNGYRVGQLWLKASARGTGLAKLLLNQALAVINPSADRPATLDCFVENRRGLAFYRREGWQRQQLLSLPIVDGSEIKVPFWRLEKWDAKGPAC